MHNVNVSNLYVSQDDYLAIYQKNGRQQIQFINIYYLFKPHVNGFIQYTENTF